MFLYFIIIFKANTLNNLELPILRIPLNIRGCDIKRSRNDHIYLNPYRISVISVTFHVTWKLNYLDASYRCLYCIIVLETV